MGGFFMRAGITNNNIIISVILFFSLIYPISTPRTSVSNNPHARHNNNSYRLGHRYGLRITNSYTIVKQITINPKYTTLS